MPHVYLYQPVLLPRASYKSLINERAGRALSEVQDEFRKYLDAASFQLAQKGKLGRKPTNGK